MLAHVLGIAEAAGVSRRFLVTGHEAAAVRALAGAAQVIENPDYRLGLSTSIRAGLAALPDDVGAAFIMLGDMPRVRPETLERLVAACAVDPSLAFVPVFEGRWGNPVLVRRALFPSLMQLHGDQGARKLLEASREVVREIPVDDPGVLADFDTPEALAGQ